MQHWTEWETRILERMLAKGVAAAEIARELNRSIGSVERKVQRIKSQQPAKRPARPPAVVKCSERQCLACRRRFKSDGVGNRICGACKEHRRDLGHLEGVTK